MVSRVNERNVDVNAKSHRSSRKGHPRLPLDVPDAFENVSVLQRDECARQTSKTFAKIVGLNIEIHTYPQMKRGRADRRLVREGLATLAPIKWPTRRAVHTLTLQNTATIEQREQ